MKYSIFDPTGNITALVETAVPVSAQPSAAAEIMKLHPDVEQVGFVSFDTGDPDTDVSLRMAGGEFCGNATMCAAALYDMRIQNEGPADTAVSVKVSGAEKPLTVELKRTEPGYYEAGVEMPPAKIIDVINYTMDILPDMELMQLPLVRMGGIDHAVITGGSYFYRLLENRKTAQVFIRRWCRLIDSDCLGLMFLKMNGTDDACGGRTEAELTPLVYVPGADTLFWENSCASGSAAVGMYLASEKGGRTEAVLNEPAGALRVVSDPANGITTLYGTTRRIIDGASVKIDTNNA